MPDTTDPTRATSITLGRRAFAVLSATAAAGGTIAAALADGTGFGKPHPPIIAEDDATIAVTRPTITYGARSIGAYAAMPNGRAPIAAVVVVQAIWGVDAQLRDVVRRFAKEGYAAIAPDLYAGLDAPSGDGASDFAPYRAIATKLSDDVVDADLEAAAAHVLALATPAALGTTSRSVSAKVGVVGFCMGGGIALRQTVDNAASFAAASIFYGKVRYGTTDDKGTITPIALDYAANVGVPLAGSWGERDTSIKAEDVRALGARLTALGKPHDVRVYGEAGHAFFDDTRASYVASAAASAWTRTLAWFGEHLR